MQVGILPSHGDLQNATKLLEGRLAGELDAPPDGWLDLPERYMHSIYVHSFHSVSPLRSSGNLTAMGSFGPLLSLIGIAEDFFANDSFGCLIQIVIECLRDFKILGPQSFIDE